VSEARRFTEWSRGDASDMDGQIGKSSERERVSQTPNSETDLKICVHLCPFVANVAA
jgi:hypothetical protein